MGASATNTNTEHEKINQCNLRWKLKYKSRQKHTFQIGDEPLLQPHFGSAHPCHFPGLAFEKLFNLFFTSLNALIFAMIFAIILAIIFEIVLAIIFAVESLFQFCQLEGLTCYDGEDLPDLYVKVGILSLNIQMINILSYNENKRCKLD